MQLIDHLLVVNIHCFQQGVHVHQNQNVSSGGGQIKVPDFQAQNPQRKNNLGLSVENS